MEYRWEIYGIVSSSSLGSSYLRSPNIFLRVNLRIGDFFPTDMNFTSLEGCGMTGMTSDQWIFGVPLPWSRVKNCCFFLLSFYSFCCWFICHCFCIILSQIAINFFWGFNDIYIYILCSLFLDAHCGMDDHTTYTRFWPWQI